VIHSNFFGQSSFATHAMCYEANIVKVPSDIPLELLGPLACGVQTGAGSVMNALKVSAGKSFAVFGAGSVGLSALMAAKVVGATTIIAVDLNEERLKTARELGATHTINPSHAQPAEAILKITGHGVNYSLDSTGLPGVIRSAVESLAPRGACGILGASGPDAEIVLNETHLMSAGRKLFGIVEGESNTDVFIPILIDLHRQGLFPFDRLVKFYNFADINQAIQDSENGTAIDAGPYENGNTDFSAQIAILRKAGVEIFNTFPLPPDLPVFWRQAAQKGLAQKVKIVQLAKAGLFEAEMEALGELGYNMASGAYWHRAFPFTSPVTGMKCDAMSDGFEAATGKPWSQQVGAQMALIDAAIAALKASNAPKNREAVAKAISTLKTETSTGLVDFTAGPVPNCAVTGLVGTQWVKSPKGAKFPFSLEVTSNVLIPAVPITATLKPYKLG
jgi:NADPH:quinone reductase-like Zn-dependent oxidoreductase